MNYSGGTSRWLPNQKKELKRWSFVFCLFIRSGQTEMLTWEKRKIDTKEFLTKMFVNAFEGASNEAPFRSYNNNNNNINNTCDDIIYRLNSLHRKHRHRTYPLKWKKTHLATLTTSCKTDPKNLMEKVRQNKREKGNRKTNTHFKATKVSASVCNGKSLYEVSELRNNRQVENFIFEALRPRQGGQQPLLLSLSLTHSLFQQIAAVQDQFLCIAPKKNVFCSSFDLPCRPTISATCSELGTGTHSVMFCDFLERSSKWTPDTDENPSMDVKAFNVLPATRPSVGECCCCCCCCWMFKRAAAISALLWFSPSPLFVKSNIESSSASFSKARWSPKGCEWSLSVAGDDGGDNNRSLSSKIDIFLNEFASLFFFSKSATGKLENLFFFNFFFFFSSLSNNSLTTAR